MKLKSTVHVYHCKYSWEEKSTFQVYSFKIEDDDYRTYVNQQEIEIDVPEQYDPRPQQIAAIEKYKQKVMADYHKTLTQINDRISKLQALEYTA